MEPVVGKYYTLYGRAGKRFATTFQVVRIDESPDSGTTDNLYTPEQRRLIYTSAVGHSQELNMPMHAWVWGVRENFIEGPYDWGWWV